VRSEYLVGQIHGGDVRLPPYDPSYSKDDAAPEPKDGEDGGVGFDAIGAKLED
jgi:hypothetical protein